MSFIILPKNGAGTAVLVEQNKDIVIDSSTPVEVNVQQPVNVEVDNNEDNPVPTVDANTAAILTSLQGINVLISDTLIEQNLTNAYLKRIWGEDLKLDNELGDS